MKKILYWPTLIAALSMGLYSCLPDAKQSRQVNIPLYPVKAIQRELVDRGHLIEVDGVFGPQTALALNIETTKE